MTTQTVRQPLLQVAAVAAGLASSGSSFAAAWTLAPSGSLTAETRQNPTLSAGETDEDELSTGFGAQAALIMQRSTETLSVSLQPVFRFYRYVDDRSLDRNEQSVDLSVKWAGEKISWAGSASGSRDTTLTSELGTTGLTQANARHQALVVAFGPSWQLSERLAAQSNVGSQTHRYSGREHSALENYRYDTASLSLSYVLSDRTNVSLYASDGRLHREGPGADSDSVNIGVRARYALSPVWTVGAGLGPSWAKAGQGGDREQGLLYSLDVSRSFEKSGFSLGVSRSQSPSGRAILTEVEQASLSFGTRIREHLSASISASVSRRKNALRELDVDLNRVRYTRAEASLSWRVAPNWAIAGSLGNSTQEVGSLFREGSTGRGYDAHLTITWNGNAYVD